MREQRNYDELKPGSLYYRYFVQDITRLGEITVPMSATRLVSQNMFQPVPIVTPWSNIQLG
jgi:hypothetical protein